MDGSNGKATKGWLEISQWWLEIVLALTGISLGLYVRGVDRELTDLREAHKVIVEAVRDNSALAAERERRFVTIEKDVEHLKEETRDQEGRIRENRDRANRKD